MGVKHRFANLRACCEMSGRLQVVGQFDITYKFMTELFESGLAAIIRLSLPHISIIS
jgi:hypothetical protein